MQALYRVPKSQRRALAQEYARRSNAVQQQKSIERGPDADTLRKRALDDARGQLVREGCTYAATGETQWQVRRSTEGRTDQFDLVANGSVFRTSGPRNLPLRFRP
jgi:hypothetical protein